MSENGLAISFEIFHVGQPRRCIVEQVLEQSLTLNKRRLPQIIAVKVKQIESLISHPSRILPGQLAAERLEIRDAPAAHHHRFTVDDRGAPEPLQSLSNTGELLRPIVTAPRINGDGVASKMGLCPIAIGFDFVNPVRSDGSPFPQGWVAKFNEVRLW